MSLPTRFLLEATLLSLIPGIFWLWFVESHRPTRAPWQRSAISFGAGGLSTLLVVAISWALEMSWPSMNALWRTSWGRFFYFVVVVGLVEEFSKLLAVRIFVYPRRDFKEAWDGLAASTAAALGFATAENIKYILAAGDATVLLPRSVLSTTGHILMSGIWGYALGLSRASTPRGKPVQSRHWVLPALLTSALGHGAYDFFLIESLPWLAVGVLGLLWAVFWSQIKDSVLESQRRLLHSYPVRECLDCHTLLRAAYRFCINCGKTVDLSSPIYCQVCLEKAEIGADVCGACGALF